MKALWKRLADAIDERNTRERALILVASSAVVFMLMDALLVAPALAERTRLVQDTLNDQVETGKITAQVQTLIREKGADPDSALKSRLAALATRQQELQRQIDAQSAELVAPARMAAVLEKILANNPRLQLVEVKTLPRVSINLEKETAPAKQGGQATADEKAAAGVYRHGVEISMRGGYLDLLEYLRAIESLPVRMFWDEVRLTATAHPTVTMRLVVYTISLEKTWLTV